MPQNTSRNISTSSHWMRSLVLVFGLMIVVSTAFGMVWSYLYWGYSTRPPTYLNELGLLTQDVQLFQVRTATNELDSGLRLNDATRFESPADIVSFDKRFRPASDPQTDIRLLYALTEHKLLPKEFSRDISTLPNIFWLLRDSKLKVHTSGYSSFSEGYRGYAVLGKDFSGSQIFAISFLGPQVSNDHYPFYEIVAKQRPDKTWQVLSSQQFFADIAGIEGTGWAVIALSAFVMSIPIACAAAFIALLVNKVYTALKANVKSNHVGP